MTTYTDEPTSAKDAPERQKRDRVVTFDGDVIGRVQQFDGGPQNGKWRWTLVWTPPEPYKNAGTTDTLKEGLQAIRDAHQRPIDDPDREHIHQRNRPAWKRRLRSNGS